MTRIITRIVTRIQRYAYGECLPRHRHRHGYVAVVLAGGYVEAGDRGRVRVAAGQVVVHPAYDAHQDAFSGAGATVLNLPLVDGLRPMVGTVDDTDAVTRLAERDPRAASEMVRDALRPVTARLDDWPDQLAATLAANPDVGLAGWAERLGLAPSSLSRGFRRAYGTSPKRYRLEQRALRAVRALEDWRGSLAGLAAEIGFADQAHLTRAVVTLTGVPPRRLRGQARGQGHG